jgi:hypothetical protein
MKQRICCLLHEVAMSELRVITVEIVKTNLANTCYVNDDAQIHKSKLDALSSTSKSCDYSDFSWFTDSISWKGMHFI